MPVSTRNHRRPLNVDRFRMVIEPGFNRGDLAAIDALFRPGFVEHRRGLPTSELAGPKGGISALRAAIPGLRLRTADTIVEDEQVWCILEGTGFHRGKLGPLPASGAVLHWGVSDICRLREGEIVEHGGIPDRMAIAEQFGMPAPSRWLIRFLMGKRPR